MRGCIVLDNIHAKDLMNACELAWSKDPSISCVSDIHATYLETGGGNTGKPFHMEIKHWKNPCTVITDDRDHLSETGSDTNLDCH